MASSLRSHVFEFSTGPRNFCGMLYCSSRHGSTAALNLQLTHASAQSSFICSLSGHARVRVAPQRQPAAAPEREAEKNSARRRKPKSCPTIPVFQILCVAFDVLCFFILLIVVRVFVILVRFFFCLFGCLARAAFCVRRAESPFSPIESTSQKLSRRLTTYSNQPRTKPQLGPRAASVTDCCFPSLLFYLSRAVRIHSHPFLPSQPARFRCSSYLISQCAILCLPFLSLPHAFQCVLTFFRFFLSSLTIRWL